MEHMNITRALVYPLEDNEWIAKLLIGALLVLVGLVFSIVLVGVLAFILLSGYVIAIARNVAAGHDVPLPRWENFGALFADGLRVTVALVVWNLPSVVLGSPALISLALLGRDERAMSAIAPIAVVILLCCGLLALVYGLFVSVITPAIYWQIAAEGRIAAALNFTRIGHILRAYFGELIIIALVLWGLNLLAGALGAALCGIGLLFTMTWYLWAEGHLIGQLGRLVQSAESPATAEALAA